MFSNQILFLKRRSQPKRSLQDELRERKALHLRNACPQHRVGIIARNHLASGKRCRVNAEDEFDTPLIVFGHDVEVSHAGGRFQLECSCGWVTPRNWTRRRAFQAVTEHVIEVVAAANRRVDGDIVGSIG